MDMIRVFPEVPGRTMHCSQVDMTEVLDEQIIYTFAISIWDDLFTNHPDFFVTHRLKTAFEAAGIKGCRYVEISHAEREGTEERIDGRFYVLRFGERQDGDDAFIDEDHHLVLSKKALEIVLTFSHRWLAIGEDFDFDDDSQTWPRAERISNQELEEIWDRATKA